MSALGDLKALVFKGYIETSIVVSVTDPGNPTTIPPVPASVKPFTFVLRTPTMIEEAEALAKGGFDALPTKVDAVTGKDVISMSGTDYAKYIVGLLCIVVRSVNGESVTPNEIEEFLKSVPSDITTQLWLAYNKISERAAVSGTELKN